MHTYHTDLRDVMGGLLACVAIVFVSYGGYGLLDAVVTTLIGLAAAGVVLFPYTLCSLEFCPDRHALASRFQL